MPYNKYNRINDNIENKSHTHRSLSNLLNTLRNGNFAPRTISFICSASASLR